MTHFEEALKKTYEFIYREISLTGVSNLDWDLTAEIDFTKSNVYYMSPISTFTINKGDMTLNEISEIRLRITKYMNLILEPFREITKVKIKFFRPYDRENYPERLRIDVVSVTTYEKDYSNIFSKLA